MDMIYIYHSKSFGNIVALVANEKELFILHVFNKQTEAQNIRFYNKFKIVPEYSAYLILFSNIVHSKCCYSFSLLLFHKIRFYHHDSHR